MLQTIGGMPLPHGREKAVQTCQGDGFAACLLATPAYGRNASADDGSDGRDEDDMPVVEDGMADTETEAGDSSALAVQPPDARQNIGPHNKSNASMAKLGSLTPEPPQQAPKNVESPLAVGQSIGAAVSASPSVTGLAPPAAKLVAPLNSASVIAVDVPQIGALQVPNLPQITPQMSIRQTVHHPVQPHKIVVQIAQSLPTADSPMTEILLRPEELGRVRIQISHKESGLHFVISTERPETEQILRRNIQELANVLRHEGYKDVSFTFGGQDRDQTRWGRGDSGGDGAVLAEFEPPTTTVSARDSPAQGIDIRI